MERAVAWMTLLRGHAERVYLDSQDTVAPSLTVAHHLLDRLKDGKIQEPFTARDIYRRGWKGIGSNQEVVEEALEVLSMHHFVKPIVSHKGLGDGRPTQHYQISPRINECINHQGQQPLVTQSFSEGGVDNQPNSSPKQVSSQPTSSASQPVDAVGGTSPVVGGESEVLPLSLEELI